MLLRSSRWFERRKNDSRLAEFFNFQLEVSFRSLQYIIALNSFTLALETSFYALKRRCDRFKTGVFSSKHVFTLKSRLERKNCDFDDSKFSLSKL